MAELTKLLHAKDYMDRLSNGIDPTSDEVLTRDSLLNNITLSRCFFFVSDILRQVIENDGYVGRRVRSTVKLQPFMLPEEMQKQIEVTEVPTMIKQFSERINSLIDLSAMQKLKVTALTGWLVNEGLLEEEVVNDRKRKIPTKAGEELGIYSEAREGQYGGYIAILYKESAQKHMINNLEQIIKLSNGE